MTDNQTRTFFLGASKRREEVRHAADMKALTEWFDLHQQHTQDRLDVFPTKIPFYMTGEEIIFFVAFIGLALAVVGFAVYLCLA